MKRLMFLLPVFIHRITGRLPFQPKPGKVTFANTGEGVHEKGVKTYIPDAATVALTVGSTYAAARRYLLYKKGSDSTAADHCAVCVASTDVPLGSSDDQPAYADAKAASGSLGIAINLFGVKPGTVRVVTDGTITDGMLVMPTTLGRVTKYTASSTNVCIGRAIIGSDVPDYATAGTVIELIHIFPFPTSAYVSQ